MAAPECRVLRAWRGQHWNWCPGFRRDAHPASDLTVDHVVPLAVGGAPLDIANCAVLCRSCNSTKGASETDRGYPHAGSARLEDRRELEDLSSPMSAFLRDRCVVGWDMHVSVDDLWAAWKAWAEDPRSPSLGAALAASSA